MGTTVLYLFDDTNPPTLAKLTHNFQALASLINGLTGDFTVELSPAPGDISGDFVPVSGGPFLGQISAPSIVVGPPNGTKHEVLTSNSAPTATERGGLLLAAAVADAAASTVAVAAADAPAQTGAYVQADVQAIATLANELKGDITQLVTDLNAAVGQFNALTAALRNAEALAP